MPNASEIHFLKDLDGSITVPIHTSASYLIDRLNNRGVLLAVDGSSIIATPRGLLTDHDRAELRRLKWHVIRALAYEAPAIQ